MNRTISTRYSRAAWSARKRGFEFTLTKEQYIGLIARPCHYCGNTSVPEVGIGLDRIDSSQGYILGNVVACCEICDKVELDYFTGDEMALLGKVIAKIKNARLMFAKSIEMNPDPKGLMAVKENK